MFKTIGIILIIVGLCCFSKLTYNVYKAIKNVYNMVNDEETRINKQN